MRTYIPHNIPINTRFSAQCYRVGNITYAKLKPLDDNINIILQEFYKSLNGTKCYSTISCKVEGDIFIGINLKILDINTILMDRYIEGIPILKFFINDKNVLKVTLDAFLVDNIKLKPIETLKMKVNSLYHIEDISNFSNTLDIISCNNMPDITIPELPETYCPELTIPQSVVYSIPK